MGTEIKSWGKTDTGRKRENNQDTFLIDEDLKLYIVADGMGGHKGGEVASALAVEAVRDVVFREIAMGPVTDPRDLLLRAYSEASEKIYEKSFENDGELRGMGTTMVVLFVCESRVFIGNVGDSRCYLYRSPDMWQVTEDHSILTEHMRANNMTEEEAMKMLPKNVITRSVGYEREVVPDFIERDIDGKESYLLCSDGLTGMVSDDDILKTFQKCPPASLVEEFVRMANLGGGDDNVTTMIVQFN